MANTVLDNMLFTQLDQGYRDSWSQFEEKYKTVEPGEREVVHQTQLETMKTIFTYATYGKKPEKYSSTGVLDILLQEINQTRPDGAKDFRQEEDRNELSYRNIVDTLRLNDSRGVWLETFGRLSSHLPEEYHEASLLETRIMTR